MRAHRVIVGTVGLVMVFATGYVAGQRQPPKTTEGQSEQMLRTIDLTEEIKSTQGRMLRMRKVTVQPGGALAVHSHANRPAVWYLLEGQMTYHYEGKPDLVANPGDTAAEDHTTTHWGESTGKVPAVWIAVDIP